MNDSTKRTVVTAAIVVILLPFGYSLVSTVFIGDPESSQPFLERPDPNYRECVRETQYMRFHHMELLKEIREDFVRYGNRGEISFNSCRECHTNREGFCNRCHNAVSLNLDCFGCHYYPETASQSSQLGK